MPHRNRALEILDFWNSIKPALNSQNLYSINLVNPATGQYYPGAEYFLARGVAKSKLTPFRTASPEPFFGDANNCCAVMLNLNPGSRTDVPIHRAGTNYGWNVIV